MNKKVIIFLIFILSLVFQAGCAKKENLEPAKEKLEPIKVVQRTEKEIMQEFNSIDKEKTKIEPVIKLLNENIAFVSKENASLMIEGFRDIQEFQRSQLDNKFYDENKMYEKFDDLLEKDINFYDMDRDEIINKVKDKDARNLLLEVIDKGYKVVSIEGSYMPIISYEFYKTYAPYATPDLREFIEIMAIDSNEIPVSGGGVQIDWDELIRRAVKQGEFIKEYPDSAMVEEIIGLYAWSLYDIFYGELNTPLFNTETNIMYDDVKEAYLEALKIDTKSNVISYLTNYMNVLKDQNYMLTNDIEKYRRSTLERIFKDLGVEDFYFGD